MTFDNDGSGTASLYRKVATGAGGIERSTTPAFDQQPLDWSRDRRFLVYTQITYSSGDPDPGREWWPAVQFPGACARSFESPVQSRRAAGLPTLTTPAGAKSTFRNSEPGKPASSALWQISDAGGQMPRWRGGRQGDFLLVPGRQDDGRSVSTEGGAFKPPRPNSCSTRVRLSCAPRISNMTSPRMASVS